MFVSQAFHGEHMSPDSAKETGFNIGFLHPRPKQAAEGRNANGSMTKEELTSTGFKS